MVSQYEDLLVSVNWVDKDGSLRVVTQNALEHPFIKLFNPGFGNKQV